MSVHEIDVDELNRLRDEGVALIDVRRVDEFDEFHVAGSVLIPLNELPNRTGEIPKGDRVAIICRTGSRSAKAVTWLNSRGYDAVNVAGGCLAWIDAGHPVEPDTE